MALNPNPNPNPNPNLDPNWKVALKLASVKGRMFVWPLKFLSQAVLEPVIGDTEAILPSITFT